MAELRETCINWVYGEDFYYISSGIVKDINEIKRAKEQHPALVNIKHTNEDGSIVAQISKELQPPVLRKKRSGRKFTEEEKQANGDRLREYHKKKKERALDEQS